MLVDLGNFSVVSPGGRRVLTARLRPESSPLPSSLESAEMQMDLKGAVTLYLHLSFTLSCE